MPHRNPPSLSPPPPSLWHRPTLRTPPDFVVLPMFRQLVAVAPRLDRTLALCAANRAEWARLAAAGEEHHHPE